MEVEMAVAVAAVVEYKRGWDGATNNRPLCRIINCSISCK